MHVLVLKLDTPNSNYSVIMVSWIFLLQIFNFMRSRENFLSQFLAHLGTSAIMDLLLQMVAVVVVEVDPDQIRQEIAVVSWFAFLVLLPFTCLFWNI